MHIYGNLDGDGDGGCHRLRSEVARHDDELVDLTLLVVDGADDVDVAAGVGDGEDVAERAGRQRAQLVDDLAVQTASASVATTRATTVRGGAFSTMDAS